VEGTDDVGTDVGSVVSPSLVGRTVTGDLVGRADGSVVGWLEGRPVGRATGCPEGAVVG
jgi:hypothetical protein